jgi:hypothetical protein
MGRAFLSGDMPAIFGFDVAGPSEPKCDAADLPSVGTWHWDVATSTVVWDEANYALHGLSPDAGPPTWAAWMATMHPSDRMEAERAVQTPIDGRVICVHYRVAKPCGGWRWLIGRGVVIMGEDGKPAHMAGTNIDADALYSSVSTALGHAIELGEMLGADDADPDRSQWLVRQIRETLRRAEFKKIA